MTTTVSKVSYLGNDIIGTMALVAGIAIAGVVSKDYLADGIMAKELLVLNVGASFACVAFLAGVSILLAPRETPKTPKYTIAAAAIASVVWFGVAVGLVMTFGI